MGWLFEIFENGINSKEVSQAGVCTALTPAMFGAFKVVVDHEATPAPGVDETDISYILVLRTANKGRNVV